MFHDEGKRAYHIYNSRTQAVKGHIELREHHYWLLASKKKHKSDRALHVMLLLSSPKGTLFLFRVVTSSIWCVPIKAITSLTSVHVEKGQNGGERSTQRQHEFFCGVQMEKLSRFMEKNDFMKCFIFAQRQKHERKFVQVLREWLELT